MTFFKKNLSAVQEGVAETPALFEQEEKPRSTPAGPVSYEAYIQRMDVEMIRRHGKPVLELRPSKIDHPRAGLGLFTTESVTSPVIMSKWVSRLCPTCRVLLVDKRDSIGQQKRITALSQLSADPGTWVTSSPEPPGYKKSKHRGRIASFLNTSLFKRSLLKIGGAPTPHI